MELRPLDPLPPLSVVRNGTLLAPEARGRQDLLIGGGKILAIGQDVLPRGAQVEEIDATGSFVVPGFIDAHVHILGAGGEGGPESRNRDITLSQITCAGVTTVIGLIGFDCLTRSVEALLAKARALSAEGITAYILTGGYTIPTPTLTGSVMRDLAFVEQVVGVGELAVSDHRSSQPTPNDLAKVVAEARVGGLLGRKRGTAVLHIGNGLAGLRPLEDLLASTEIPADQILPTHVNRNADLFTQSIAYAKSIGTVDITAGVAPHLGFPDAVKPSKAIRRLLDAGVPIARITLSSDANGNMPVRNEAGQVIRLDVQEVIHLYREIRDLAVEEGVPLEQAIQTVTANPARVFGLKKKGTLAPGKDADFLLLDDGLQLQAVYARGRLVSSVGAPTVLGVFESAS